MKCILYAMALVAACHHLAIAAEFEVESDCRPYADLWFKPSDGNDFLRPPVKLTPNNPIQTVELAPGRTHYLVVMDRLRNEDRLGWYNFDEIVRPYVERGEVPTIVLSCLMVWEDRVREVVVTRTRPETRIEEYKVVHPVSEEKMVTVREWDRYRRHWVTRQKTIKVWKHVAETKTREYTVNVPYRETIEKPYKERVRKVVLKIKSRGGVATVQPIAK